MLMTVYLLWLFEVLLTLLELEKFLPYQDGTLRFLVLVKGVEHLVTKRKAVAKLVHNSSGSSGDRLVLTLPPSCARDSSKFSVTMPSEITFANPFTHLHEIHSTPCSQIDNTLPMLTAAKAV
ncbi:hypothetical protein F2Q70_00009284 [Brassica cretica]|uniref:Uncharacterized protein n=1 Tax=Brassica cretica TaxID=69181 RepID=A0A8S9LZF0_BRACR|nr:hypothetical protein F2Q70_00009284 [Brassica cretica]